MSKRTSPITARLRKARAGNPKLNATVETKLQVMRLIQELEAQRARLNSTKSELARTLKVSQPTISKVLSGRTSNVELRTIFRLASALKTTVEINIVPAPERRASRASVSA